MKKTKRGPFYETQCINLSPQRLVELNILHVMFVNVQLVHILHILQFV